MARAGKEKREIPIRGGYPVRHPHSFRNFPGAERTAACPWRTAASDSSKSAHIPRNSRPEQMDGFLRHWSVGWSAAVGVRVVRSHVRALHHISPLAVQECLAIFTVPADQWIKSTSHVPRVNTQMKYFQQITWNRRRSLRYGAGPARTSRPAWSLVRIDDLEQSRAFNERGPHQCTVGFLKLPNEFVARHFTTKLLRSVARHFTESNASVPV